MTWKWSHHRPSKWRRRGSMTRAQSISHACTYSACQLNYSSDAKTYCASCPTTTWCNIPFKFLVFFVSFFFFVLSKFDNARTEAARGVCSCLRQTRRHPATLRQYIPPVATDESSMTRWIYKKKKERKKEKKRKEFVLSFLLSKCDVRTQHFCFVWKWFTIDQ